MYKVLVLDSRTAMTCILHVNVTTAAAPHWVKVATSLSFPQHPNPITLHIYCNIP